MKKILLSILFSFIWIYSFAVANIFTGATDSNWGTSTNWSLAAVPTASDGNTATFNVTSPNCTVNTSARVCNSIDFTGYTNTITMTNNITVSGAITFQANQSSRVAGAGTLLINETATITSNGGTWPNPFSFGGTSKTTTLADDMRVTGLVTLNYGTAGILNGNNLIAATSVLGSNVATTGTTLLQMTGTGSLTTTGTGTIRISITIKSTANITFGTAINFGAATFTVEAGATVTTTGNTFTIATTTGTLNTSVMGTTTNAFNNLSVTTSATTLTLTSDLYGTGTLTTGAASTSILNGAFNINWSGTVTIGTNWTGTATLVYTGTGTFAGGTGASILALNTTINTAGATFGSFTYRTNTLTWTSIGTSTFSGFVLIINTNSPTMTVNCASFTIPTLTMGNTSNLTACTFNGTNGFTATNLTINPSIACTVTWKNGLTYTVSSSLVLGGTVIANPLTFVSASPGNTYTFTLTNGATCNVERVICTDANSGNGATIWDYKNGALTNTTNWNTLPTQPATITTAN